MFTLLAIGFMAAFSYIPVAKQYRIEHPKTPKAPSINSLSASEIADEIERRAAKKPPLPTSNPPKRKEPLSLPKDIGATAPTGQKDGSSFRSQGTIQSNTMAPLAPGSSCFLHEAYADLHLAISEAEKSDKLLFVVIYDEHHPTMSKLEYSLGYFMEYQATKRLVDTYFVPAIIKASEEKAKMLVPEDDPLENCLWVVLDTHGKILSREGVYANPDEGLKRVRAVIASYGKK